MKDHVIQWTAPQPLWSSSISTMNQPSILRFATDTFMEDFLKTAEQSPALLKDYVAQWETWRAPAVGTAATKALLQPTEPLSSFARTLKRLSAKGTQPTEKSSSTEGKLKLYQPAHQRHYLLTSSLVCGITGLPDRKVDPGKQERATFVIRRLLPPGQRNTDAELPELDLKTWSEYAYVTTPGGTGWQAVSSTSPSTSKVLVVGEEQLPLFAVACTEDDGRARKLFGGVIPVAKRETYMGASPLPAAGDATTLSEAESTDPRMFTFWTDVTEPWKRLLESAALTAKMAGEEAPDGDEEEEGAETQMRTAREKAQVGSWYVLLDFAKYLEEQIPNAWKKLNGEATDSLYTEGQSILVETLKEIKISGSLIAALKNSRYVDSDIAPTLADALVRVRTGDVEENLENVILPYYRDPYFPPNNLADLPASPYGWPEFLFPLADFEKTAPLPPARDGVAEDSDPLQASLDRIDYLSDLVLAALPESAASTAVEPPLAAKPVLDTRQGWFVIRCVFERLNCGPLDPTIVSDITQPFQLAGFFDPDAPARPIRISLPVDTSTAGFRKFNKNTAFMVSDMLCSQLDRIKGLTLGDLVRTVLPWPFHKDLSVPEQGPCTDKKNPSLQAGEMCSLSIPIITICALILLMIMVSILDYIFRWLPYFFICFPIPGFKAKAKA